MDTYGSHKNKHLAPYVAYVSPLSWELRNLEDLEGGQINIVRSWIIAYIIEWDVTGYDVDIIEGRLEVKLPTTWTDEKQRWEESERREE